MALNNELEAIVPRLLARGLLVLRRNAVLPQLVNRDYQGDAARKGKTIDVDVPAPGNVVDVVPSNIKPEPVGKNWTSIPIELNQWKSSDFGLTDKERAEVLATEKFLPKQANSAVTALVTNVDTFLLNFYKQAYQVVGDPTKPAFDGSVDNAIDAGAILKDSLVPQNEDCYMVVNPSAEASAMKNSSLLNVNMSGTMDAMRDGTIEKKLGFFWFLNQGCIMHETTANDDALGAKADVGDTTLTLKTAGITAKEGDLFTIAGDDQHKVVKSIVGKELEFAPALTKVAANNSVVKFVKSHVNNLAFHPDAIAMATRPLQNEGDGMGSMISTMTDAMTGLSLRLEVTRQHKQVLYEYDLLYGGAVIRPEFLVRVIANK